MVWRVAVLFDLVVWLAFWFALLGLFVLLWCFLLVVCGFVDFLVVRCLLCYVWCAMLPFPRVFVVCCFLVVLYFVLFEFDV